MTSFERIVTHPATATVAIEVIEQPNVNLESLKQVILNLFNAPTALSTAPGTKPWYFDSGCCNHMSSITAHFSSMSPNNSFPDIYPANGSSMNDPQTGQLLRTGRKVGRLFELNYLHIPDNKMDTPSFPNDQFIQTLLCAIELESLQIPYQQIFQVCAATNISPLHLWHSRLGHTFVALSFSSSHSHSTTPFNLVHSDVWGPSPTPTMGGSSHSELSQIYIDFATMVKTQFSKIIKVLRTDNATEYLSTKLQSFLKEQGTLPQQSCPYTSEQNGRAERKHRHILDSVHALLISSSCPERFWGEAALTAAYLINRIPSSVLNNYDSNASTSDELYNASPHALTSSVEDDLPAGNALDNFEHSSTSSSTNELVVPSSSHPTRIQTRSDGSMERYKARLVAKGFTQEYGINYEETFALVARLTSVHSLLAIVAIRRWKLFQMDVKNAFLNGDLEEEVYMKPPHGLHHLPNKVCRLCRALYGLKQSPRVWYAKFSATVSEFGFTSSPHDTALFIHKTARGMVLLLLYVDDMIITRDDVAGVEELKQSLSQKFEMKDLGVLSYFLGLEVTSSDDGYLLSQVKYASDLVSKAELNDRKSVSTPLEPNVKLTPMDGSPLSDPTHYRQLVGSLVYLTTTHPDIAYAVHIVSQFMAAPRFTHYVAVLRIIRYVKGTLFHGLHFSANSSPVLRAYSDADWAGDPSDCRSTTGYCLFLGNSLIYWRSKKQVIPSRSSTEAEYKALRDTTSELLSLRWLLQDIGIPQPSSTDLYCDNQSAMQIAHNDVFHECTKHIEVDCHFIRHHVAQGTVHLVFIGSTDQLANLFTKAHFPGRFRTLLSKLKMVSSQPL
ncbi:hypothetical protein SLEP1_g15862 [Rubroshorea leprosula]|uniref:Integrase catalytic domain-containing protein n=1 Tax=Rubroshorea leprosula TaxID=152421 RepID=A0AAV5INU7_9ROSI|nr:hypothetical protein SLEP1_g15862 [Rubroshorea leprosula]